VSAHDGVVIPHGAVVTSPIPRALARHPSDLAVYRGQVPPHTVVPAPSAHRPVPARGLRKGVP